MAPDAPTLGTADAPLKSDVRQAGDDTADQVEGQESGGAHRPLDVVTEYPQVEHVASQVHPATVEEHRREERGPERQRDEGRQIVTHAVFPRHHTPGGDERLQRARRSLAKLQEKSENIEDDQGDRDDGSACALSAIITHRKHIRLRENQQSNVRTRLWYGSSRPDVDSGRPLSGTAIGAARVLSMS